MSRTLLLADGSITIQRVIELTFAHEDVRVMTVSDGRRAMQLLESEQPDIALLDVDLPEMDGYALAAHMRRVPRLKQVPILLLAGAFEPVDQAKARDVGSDGVILKPFEPQVVVTRVKELIDQRDRMATPPPTRAESPAAAVAMPRPTPVAAPMPEPVAAEQAKGRADSAFLRVASRERDTPPPMPDSAPAVESLELPTAPLWDGAGSVTSSLPSPTGAPPMAFNPLTAVGHASPATAPAASAPPPKVTLANAFTALLAAEQSASPASAPAAAISEASIEDAVRRVLVRMTDELVRRIVLDTAERLIREEIERIKANPD
jgi:DNA-binding response OmpR family regulator